MTIEMKNELMKAIAEAKVVSFDVFDTLLFRKVNEPEIIFDLVGRHYGIHGFRKLRIDAQNEASRRAYTKAKHPHADMNEIYEVLKETRDITVNWDEVKQFEIDLERDALVENPEMLEVFNEAKKLGKRVIVTTDMYLLASTIGEYLEANGFGDIDHIYCSADEYKAKFNKELFTLVADREKCDYKDILHIGDNKSADVEIPKSLGMSTFLYVHDADMEKLKQAGGTEIDSGIYKILYDAHKGFWYNFGVEAGGPIYLGLTLWIEDILRKSDRKVFLLSRDGYNLYNILKNRGHNNVEYLYTSRRALTLAGITQLDDESLKLLPPYTLGQTVGEILDYLCIDRDKIVLEGTGIESFDFMMNTIDDYEMVYSVYKKNDALILEQCRKERETAAKYFEEKGFFDSDSYVFDCGWSGSSQFLIDRLKKALGYDYENLFIYFGIMDRPKSSKQMHGKHYLTYLFDFYKNFGLQVEVKKSVVIYEMLFSAPHETVIKYDHDGPVFEAGESDATKEHILSGIIDYIKAAESFAKKYEVELTPDKVIGHISRIVNYPTKEEAITIGNIENVDGFAHKSGEKKFIGRISDEQYRKNPLEVYWPSGILMSDDVSEEVKKSIASQFGLRYPNVDEKYHLENEHDLIKYRRWLRKHKNIEPEADLSYRPMFSIVMPVYNTLDIQLREAIDSVLAQTYDNFELVIVDDASTWPNVVPTLKEYESNQHITVIFRQINGHISTSTNDGIAVAKGDFLVFMDCDDLLAPNALYEIAKKLNENRELDFIYTDEDKITEDGKIRHFPFFKPDWSPELFWGENYTNHLSAYRMSVVRETGGLRSAYNGSQDYDFVLRFMEHSDNSRVGHISKILYHWRERKESVAFAIGSKNYAADAARYAKEDALKRRKIAGHLEYVSEMSQYRVVFDVIGNPGVSIVILSKDNFTILRQCIDSIREFTNYSNYEIIVVDNGSTEENKTTIERYLSDNNCIYVYEKSEFNFSKMCNLGAKHSNNEFLLFLNDDIEIFQEDWLDRMIGQALQPEVGVVGAKLYYPLSTLIQHAGGGNLSNGPQHNFMRQDDDYAFNFGFNRLDNNVICVTGACLLIKKAIFDKVGGFDESFAVAYNDVDLCFKVHKLGYYIVVRQDVHAYHYESYSRGSDFEDKDKFFRLSGELQRLYIKHPKFKDFDPFVNPNLHSYLGAEIDLNDNIDEVSVLDDSGSVPESNASIDRVIVDDVIKIFGWSFIPDRSDNAELERYIIFEDIYGYRTKAPAVNVRRDDLVEARQGREDLRMCGFECIVDKDNIKMDKIPYRIGVQTIDPEGVSHIYWESQLRNVVRGWPYRRKYGDCRSLKEFVYHEHTHDIRYYIDLCEASDDGIEISGWAFCNGDLHYQYNRKLILFDGRKTAYECDLPCQERSDVALSMPEVKFICNTGFDMCIANGVCDLNKEYDIIIRFSNTMNNDDIQDIIVAKLCV